MQTDKYTKVILTLIAIGLFSLGCGGGVSLEEVNELRQEIANLQKQVESLEDTVRTGRLEIVNGDGQTVISASVRPDGNGELAVVNKNGTPAVTASVNANGASLSVWNKAFEAGVVLDIDHDGGGSVVVRGGEGKQMISAGADRDTGGFLSVQNKTGEQVVTLGVDDYGNGEVGVWNRKGKGRVWRSK